MDKESLINISAKWFLIITFFPIQIFSYFKLHTHCKNYVYLIVLSIFGHINAGKSRILGIFIANYGFLLHFAGINPKTREILAKCLQIQSNFPKTRNIR